ncbi:MAG: glycosyltransferase family 87 protein [Actinomycetota bacterium]|nr:glycosyltransferase family 87 protein [Actinomycetota bacterium]
MGGGRRGQGDPAGGRWAVVTGWAEALRSAGGAVLRWVGGLSPEWADVLVYGASALFAVLTIVIAGIPLYRQWGEMAVGPYLAAAVGMAVVASLAARHRRSAPGHEAGQGATGAERQPATRGPVRWTNVARVVAFVVVLAGATVVPLTMEVIWRSEGNPSAHVQPEVVVVERAGARVATGKDPYQVIDRNGHVLVHVKGQPTYELYYPYLPGMVLFGLSSSLDKHPSRLADARVQFLAFTAIVAVLALAFVRGADEPRRRVLQLLTVLPAAALPLATGGDDMPVVALMLLALVALQRRRPLLAGLAMGAASSLKFTAWPLAVLAAWVVFDRRPRRATPWYVAGVVVVTGAVVLPVALANPAAFIDNVVRFPLGLSGIASPAASPLPGHLLVSAFPRWHRVYVYVLVLGGGALLALRLWKAPPRDAAAAATFTGWVMLIAIMLAPATRFGYLLYPVDLFAWGWMLRRADEPAAATPSGWSGVHGRALPSLRRRATSGLPGGGGVAVSPAGGLRRDAVQLESGTSKIVSANGVAPVALSGEITTPHSQ